MMGVGVVEGAYDIAWNYLNLSGAISDSNQAHDRILCDVVHLYNRGERNRLRLGNKVISMFMQTSIGRKSIG